MKAIGKLEPPLKRKAQRKQVTRPSSESLVDSSSPLADDVNLGEAPSYHSAHVNQFVHNNPFSALEAVANLSEAISKRRKKTKHRKEEGDFTNSPGISSEPSSLSDVSSIANTPSISLAECFHENALNIGVHDQIELDATGFKQGVPVPIAIDQKSDGLSSTLQANSHDSNDQSSSKVLQGTSRARGDGWQVASKRTTHRGNDHASAPLAQGTAAAEWKFADPVKQEPKQPKANLVNPDTEKKPRELPRSSTGSSTFAGSPSLPPQRKSPASAGKANTTLEGNRVSLAALQSSPIEKNGDPQQRAKAEHIGARDDLEHKICGPPHTEDTVRQNRKERRRERGKHGADKMSSPAPREQEHQRGQLHRGSKVQACQQEGGETKHSERCKPQRRTHVTDGEVVAELQSMQPWPSPISAEPGQWRSHPMSQPGQPHGRNSSLSGEDIASRPPAQITPTSACKYPPFIHPILNPLGLDDPGLRPADLPADPEVQKQPTPDDIGVVDMLMQAFHAAPLHPLPSWDLPSPHIPIDYGASLGLEVEDTGVRFKAQRAVQTRAAPPSPSPTVGPPRMLELSQVESSLYAKHTADRPTVAEMEVQPGPPVFPPPESLYRHGPKLGPGVPLHWDSLVVNQTTAGYLNPPLAHSRQPTAPPYFAHPPPDAEVQHPSTDRFTPAPPLPVPAHLVHHQHHPMYHPLPPMGFPSDPASAPFVPQPWGMEEYQNFRPPDVHSSYDVFQQQPQFLAAEHFGAAYLHGKGVAGSHRSADSGRMMLQLHGPRSLQHVM
eukprot:GGOE01044684.1.p1 GENE.GGOE01044684.1~~GGOE01044684.1.p1  ORF type:complete len:878 (-),score=95.74 GGOE01044684.1:377-2713(-)